MIRCNNCGWFNPDTATHCEMCDESLAGFPKVDPPDASQEDEDDVQSIEAPVVQPVEEPTPEKEDPTAAPEPEVQPQESLHSPKADPLSATIRFADSSKSGKKSAEKPAGVSGRGFAATVMDASAALKNSTPIQCPKCRYPVYGGTETCPNCGATLKNVLEEPRQVSKPEPKPEEKPAPKKSSKQSAPSITVKDHVEEVIPQFKQTVRDFPGSGPTKEAPRKIAPRPTARDLKATIREIPVELMGKEAMESNSPVSPFRLIPVESPDSAVIELVPGSIVTIGNRRYKFVKE